MFILFDDNAYYSKFVYQQKVQFVSVLRGKVMHEVGTEVLGFGAVRLTGFLKELLQQRNINFQSLYTVRAIKEVATLTSGELSL